MNKLSELSKPTAEVVSKFGDPEAFGEREIKVLADLQKLAYGTKFYSQEYVSALLAELEAKDKRIAEADLVVAAAKCDDELWDAMAHRLKTMEDKLATPVRLPALLQPESDAVNGMIFANGKNEAIAECSVAIRQAGFLSEASQIAVEGDE